MDHHMANDPINNRQQNITRDGSTLQPPKQKIGPTVTKLNKGSYKIYKKGSTAPILHKNKKNSNQHTTQHGRRITTQLWSQLQHRKTHNVIRS